MCTVSMVGDYWSNRTLPQSFPNYPSYPVTGPTREEFDRLKKAVEELKNLLVAAKRYDDALGEPHCEHEDKVRLIKELAKMTGVDMKDIFE